MWPREDDELAAAVGAALVARRARVAVVETTAGGLISARLVSVPGASRWFERGVVAYTRESKLELAPRAAAVMAAHGAVSGELVAVLAEAMRERSGAEFALAESGIAGPQDGRRSSKAPGTVVIAVATPEGTVVEEDFLPGTRAEVMIRIAERALEVLREAVVP